MNDSIENDAPEMDSRRALVFGALAVAGMLAARSANAANAQKKLIVFFQRFAADGLMELVPYGDPAFSTLRTADSWPDGTLVDIGSPYWKLHPKLNTQIGGYGSVYSELWQKNQLALIPGTCISTNTLYDTRSHFTSQAYLETAYATGSDIGFCSRALSISQAPNAGDPILRGVCLSDYVPDLARGDYQFLSIAEPESYSLSSRHANIQQPLEQLYAGQTGPGSTAGKTAAAIDTVRINVAGRNPIFDNDNIGRLLRHASQFILAGSAAGSQILTIDAGGWDHHVNVQSQMNTLMASLNSGLVHLKAALGGDAAGSFWGDTTIVFVTEFGRTLGNNDSKGTDHGWGSLMMVAGGAVKGGIYNNVSTTPGDHTKWPVDGLNNTYWKGRNCVPAVNDYRKAMGEIFYKALGITQLDYIFPGYFQPNVTPAFWGLL